MRCQYPWKVARFMNTAWNRPGTGVVNGMKIGLACAVARKPRVLPDLRALTARESDPMEMKNLIHDSGANATREAMNVELGSAAPGRQGACAAMTSGSTGLPLCVRIQSWIERISFRNIRLIRAIRG
jgi:hypothetical protein